MTRTGMLCAAGAAACLAAVLAWWLRGRMEPAAVPLAEAARVPASEKSPLESLSRENAALRAELEASNRRARAPAPEGKLPPEPVKAPEETRVAEPEDPKAKLHDEILAESRTFAEAMRALHTGKGLAAQLKAMADGIACISYAVQHEDDIVGDTAVDAAIAAADVFLTGDLQATDDQKRQFRQIFHDAEQRMDLWGIPRKALPQLRSDLVAPELRPKFQGIVSQFIRETAQLGTEAQLAEGRKFGLNAERQEISLDPPPPGP